MAFVYFSDADKVIHKVPSDLTHFEPNDESDPYVLDKLSVAYASGHVMKYKVNGSYFDTLKEFIDETSPSFPPDTFIDGIQLPDFVRFLGTHKAIPAIVNYMLVLFGMDSIIIGCVGRNVDYDNTSRVQILYLKPGFGNGILDLKWSTQASMAAGELRVRRFEGKVACTKALLRIVDQCEQVRDAISYVESGTNKRYAKRLNMYLTQIDSILQAANPMKHLFMMQWLVNDFDKIPRRIRDGWLAA